MIQLSRPTELRGKGQDAACSCSWRDKPLEAKSGWDTGGGWPALPSEMGQPGALRNRHASRRRKPGPKAQH